MANAHLDYRCESDRVDGIALFSLVEIESMDRCGLKVPIREAMMTEIAGLGSSPELARAYVSQVAANCGPCSREINYFDELAPSFELVYRDAAQARAAAPPDLRQRIFDAIGRGN